MSAQDSTSPIPRAVQQLYDTMSASMQQHAYQDASASEFPLQLQPAEIELDDNLMTDRSVSSTSAGEETEDLTPRTGMLEEKMAELAAPRTAKEHAQAFMATRGLTRQLIAARLVNSAIQLRTKVEDGYRSVTGSSPKNKKNRCLCALCLFTVAVVILIVVALTQLYMSGGTSLPHTNHSLNDQYTAQNAFAQDQTLLTATDAIMAESATFRDMTTDAQYIITKGIFSDQRIRVDARTNVSSSSGAIQWSAWGTMYQFMNGQWKQTIKTPAISVTNVPWSGEINYSTKRGMTLDSDWRVVIYSSSQLDGPGNSTIEAPLQPYLNVMNATLLPTDVLRDWDFYKNFESIIQRYQSTYSSYADHQYWLDSMRMLYQSLSINTELAAWSLCTIAVDTISSKLNKGIFLRSNCSDNNNDTDPTPVSLLATTALLYDLGRSMFLRDLCYSAPASWSSVCREFYVCQRDNTRSDLSSGQAPCTCMFQLYLRLSGDLRAICGPCAPNNEDGCICWVKAYLFRQLLRMWPCEGTGACLVQTARVPSSVQHTCYDGEGCGNTLQLEDQELTQPCLTLYSKMSAVPTFYPLVQWLD